MNPFKAWYFLSNNQTTPEKTLEPAIAALGERYRAQWLFPRIHHIADFVLLDRKVIIEVDGASHKDPKQRYKDLIHTIYLEEAGWQVVRCTNEEVMKSPYVTLSELLHFRLNHRPTLEELRMALGQLPPPPARKRAKPRKSEPAPSPKKAPRASRKSEAAQKSQ